MISALIKEEGMTWLDITGPTEDELKDVAAKYGLHSTSLEDCLDPKHQPKFEEIDDVIFLIFRFYDCFCDNETDSVHKITRKLAMFIGKDFLITVHRRETELLKPVLEWWQEHGRNKRDKLEALVVKVIHELVVSYSPALDLLEADLDRFEASIFAGESTTKVIQEIHWFRRRVSTIRRLFRQSLEVILNLNETYEEISPMHQDLKERLERCLALTESLREGANDILNTQLSLASHRTNQVIRLLTIFSVFFLPLTFIVGIYGMNFQYMPELHWKYGYLYTWIIMIIVTIAIYRWFKSKGWLR